MTCEKSFNRYLALDRNERVPISVTLHLLVCPVCRTGVRQLTLAERVLSRPLAVSAGTDPAGSPADPVISSALERIRASGYAYPEEASVFNRVSLSRWIIAGGLLASSFAVVPFSTVGGWSSDTFGNSFSVPFAILCGVAVTGYCGLFVGTNIDFFVKRFGFRHTAA